MLGHILRHIGADAKVADVHHGDIVALHRAITDTGHPVLANRTVSCASRMFSLALKPMAGENKPWRDQAQGNPCKGIERNPETAKERFLAPAEIAAVVEGLDAYGRAPVADCIRLVMLTGCRPGEAMLATWAQFDAQPGFWIKPSSHTKQRKEHRLPLSAPALALIADIRTRRGDINPDDYVFPGQRPGQPLQQLRTCWDAVCAHAGLTGIRIYDLRHTFAATGAGGGLSLPLIGRLLGHTQASDHATLRPSGRRSAARGRRQDCLCHHQSRQGRQGRPAAGRRMKADVIPADRRGWSFHPGCRTQSHSASVPGMRRTSIGPIEQRLRESDYFEPDVPDDASTSTTCFATMCSVRASPTWLATMSWPTSPGAICRL